jgi:hypothetical protein
MLMNAVVNSPVADAAMRVSLRKELDAAGLKSVLEKLRLSNNDDIAAQVDLYEEKREHDTKSVEEISVDIDLRYNVHWQVTDWWTLTPGYVQ